MKWNKSSEVNPKESTIVLGTDGKDITLLSYFHRSFHTDDGYGDSEKVDVPKWWVPLDDIPLPEDDE